MKRLQLAALTAALIAPSATLVAHPAPFSYVDVRIQAGALQVTIAAHDFDLAHDLGIDPPDRLLDGTLLLQKAPAMSALLESRFALDADGQILHAGPWSGPEIAPEQQLIRFHARYELAAAPGKIAVTARLFPYDPAHQTLVNVYERDTLTLQQILDARQSRFEYFTDTGSGLQAAARRFAAAGMARLLNGGESVLFLIGLLLIGGSFRRLASIVAAFMLADTVTLSLAAWNILTLPARIVAPAMALSVVYVGVDNLMMRGGRDFRVWIALGFGFVHGFGMAIMLNAMDQPRRIGWSLYPFSAGIAAGQLLIVAAVLSAMSIVRARREGADRTLALAGSVAVTAVGAFWFVQRLFFPGTIS